jgi:hypothetical protein
MASPVVFVSLARIDAFGRGSGTRDMALHAKLDPGRPNPHKSGADFAVALVTSVNESVAITESLGRLQPECKRVQKAARSLAYERPARKTPWDLMPPTDSPSQ